MKNGVRVYESLLADEPDTLDAHLRLARLLLRLDRHEDAETHLHRVGELQPDARQAYLASGAGLAGAFRTALEQFRARYEITYVPSTTEPGWHAIDVRVPGRPGVTVRTRRGYQR